jgi:hypothetical protein
MSSPLVLPPPLSNPPSNPPGPQTIYSHPPIGVCKKRAALTIALFTANADIGVWALEMAGMGVDKEDPLFLSLSFLSFLPSSFTPFSFLFFRHLLEHSTTPCHLPSYSIPL